MTLNLYWNVASQPARSVKCLLNLGKIPHNPITMDMINNQTRTKQYLQMNPLGQIPFITDGNFKLAESNAILIYLCEKYSQLNKYYGKDISTRGKVNQHLSWHQNYFRPALFRIIFLKNYEGIKKNMPVYRQDLQRAEKDMFKAMQELQNLFSINKTKYAVGDDITIADLQYFFEITNLIVYEKDFSKYALISQWYKRVQSNQQVMKIQKQWQTIAPFITKALKDVPIVEKSKL